MCTPKPSAPFTLDKGMEIPSIPLVLIKIIQALDSDTSSAKALEDLIMHDPALSARILRLANSAFYSFRAKVKTISHAIALLGINLVTSLAIGNSIFDSFSRGAKSEAALIQQLWTHSCCVGVLAREAWSINGFNKKEGEYVFICGLLHDIGKAILFKAYPNNYGAIFAAAKKESEPAIFSCEMENYGMDHAGIGALLAKQWGFPEELASIIGRHHDPAAVEIPMVRMVMAADLVAKELAIGYDGDEGRYESADGLRRQIDVPREISGQLVKFASRERENIEGFFRITS
ncbi:MAG TPA: HDOD domain-containing protein [Acidobacteriota bacterium]|nr:HDOD domain-containing protein [Acidobacteriota bacterium]